MRWFKHESDARNSLKLRKVRRKYGADGYAIYWFCLEAIAYGVDKDNLTFDLKEDAETIGFELSIQEKRVEEIMNYMVELGLFEHCSGIITCLKLAERLDKSMTNSPKLRKWLDAKSVMTLPDGVSESHDDVNTCHELDKDKEKDKNNKNPYVEEIPSTSKKTVKPKKFVFSDGQLKMANMMYQKILEVVPREPKPNFESWANDIRLAVKALKITNNDFWALFLKANNDHFWSTNIRSPKKLREKYPELEVKLNEANKPVNYQGKTPTTEPETAGDRLRNRLRSEGYDI